MSLRRIFALLTVLMLILSALPMAFAAEQTDAPTQAQTAQEPAEQEEEIPWAYTAMILALITTFLQYKFIHGRR